VGAGDTVVAAFSACIGAGATPAQAIAVANLAAAVTVQKRHQTGTASLPEILNLYATYFPYESQSMQSVPSGTAYLPDAGAAPLLD
jgi:bifunctional ADP-heptose synthase (sugar kinase/adenylyltransferase)